MPWVFELVRMLHRHFASRAGGGWRKVEATKPLPSREGLWRAGRFGPAISALAAATALCAPPLLAQASPGLSAALIRLNRDPRDVEALIAAGNAALATGDADAATGFFNRANSLSQGNPRVEAGLAAAKARSGDPFAAIPLFIAAQQREPIPAALLGDRGLAYDLIGDNINAQADYRQALGKLSLSGSDAMAGAEISRRLALSLAIAGDRRGSEAVLSALLQKQDRAAWRTRVFALAILGYEEEAVATANSTMPSDLAIQIAPYLRFMRRLTPAQQAAAANLGHFPQSAQIGQDDPRVAQFAHTLDRSRVADTAGSNLVPQGTPLGQTDRLVAAIPPAPERRTRRASPAAPALADAARQVPAAPTSLPANLLAPRQNVPAAAPVPVRVAAAPIQPPVQVQAQASAPVRLTMGPPAPEGAANSVSAEIAPAIPPRPSAAAVPFAVAAPIRPQGQVQPQVSGPVRLTMGPLTPEGAANPVSPVVASAAPPRPSATSAPFAIAAPSPHVPGKAAQPSFAAAFSGMGQGVVDGAPESGAVDLRRISPKRPKPPAPKLPPPPSYPSRIWVELGVGRDSDRIAFDWRRMVRGSAALFAGKRPFVSSWARTNRLLTGPFESDKAAQAFAERLHRADNATAFVWTSAEGQAVDPLDAQ